MARKSIKKLIAVVTLATTLFTTSIASAADTTVKDSTQSSTSSDTSDIFTNAENGNMEGVLKVNVDDDGNLTYQEPVKASSDSKWGSKSYDENRTFTWDNVNMYYLMTDRFVNGDTDNDHSYGRGKDASGKEISGYKDKTGYFHGGDLAGLTTKVEEGYFDNLGTDAIWITAPYEQIHGAMSGNAGFKHFSYHGYYALDFTEVDANWGTEKDLETFIDTAHAHGIRVVFDIVMNHAGYANPYDANEFGYGTLTSNWADTYYNTPDSELDWYYDYDYTADENGVAGKGMMSTKVGDWETNWWGSKWVRMVKDRFATYGNQAIESNEGIPICQSGMPDFVTEGTEDPGMPSIMKKKWSADKLATQEKELDEFVAKFKDTDSNNKNKCVTTYLCKWLSDWVRKYGVDGFRCDTAKHVEKCVWGQLKEACVPALKEWRENNPTKAGAKWTDDFWMTGEHYEHGVGKDDYFTIGKFDSMINFKFQGVENSSGSALDGTYSGYASSINNDPSFNVLSYISSHDKKLGARSANAGTALLLCPGGVQTFYGDETGRKPDGSANEEQACRGNMNWETMDKGILSNWQKIGQFRTEHPAVGAGKHTKLSDAPYTFSRTYTSNEGLTDKVVVALPGSASECTVSCEGVFADGTKLTDSYSGKEYTVKGGTVTATPADANGVILLSEGAPTKKTSVSASKDSGNFYDESLQVTLSVVNADEGEYSINEGDPVKFENGDTITVAESAEIGDSFKLEIKASGENGDDSKTYTYTRTEKPKYTGFTVHAKRSDWASDSMNIWAYDESEKSLATAKWPGDAMTKDENGWFTMNYPEAADKYYVILSSGTSRSVPEGETDPIQTGEVWYYLGKDGKPVWSTTDPDASSNPPVSKPTVSSLTADPKEGIIDKETTFTAKATGGTGDLSYEFFNGKTSIGKSDDGTCTWTPDKADTYDIKVVVTDEDKQQGNKPLSYKVTDGKVVTKEFAIKSAEADSDTIKVGESATITVETENGTGDVQYKFSDGDTVLKDYSDENEYTFEPEDEGDYTITVTAKDEDGNEDSKDVEITVEPAEEKPPVGEETPVTIASLTANKETPQEVGSTITFTAKKTTGTGVGTVNYAFYINDEDEPIQEGSATKYTWTPDKEGTYTIKVVITDQSKTSNVENSKNTKSLTYTINKKGTPIETPTDKLAVSLTSDKESAAIGDKITFTAKPSNAEGTVTYTFYVDGIKQKSTDNKFEWTPNKAGSYEIKVVAQDEEGNKAENVIDDYDISAKQEDPKNPSSEGDSRNVMPIAVIGVMALAYVAYSKKTKQAR